MARRRVTKIEVTFDDGEVLVTGGHENMIYIERQNFDSVRDEHGKTRQNRKRWIDYEVHWSGPKEPVRK